MRVSLIFHETANDVSTTYTALHVKWVQENQPEIWGKVRHILVAKDYIKYKLTGQLVTDYAEASGTLVFDVQKNPGRMQPLISLVYPKIISLNCSLQML